MFFKLVCFSMPQCLVEITENCGVTVWAAEVIVSTLFPFSLLLRTHIKKTKRKKHKVDPLKHQHEQFNGARLWLNLNPLDGWIGLNWIIYCFLVSKGFLMEHSGV